jgi:RNA polymerase sigma-70 factor (ECF subfamily)
MLAAAELVWLLAAVAKGDEAAFERLYQATQAKLYGVTLRILRRPDLADEALQETYVRIWCEAGAYNPRLGSPVIWMVAIARSGALDMARRRMETSVEDESGLFDVEADEQSPLAQSEMTENLQRLLACMGRLQEEDRRVILLAYYNGWSREQLAYKFQEPVNTIKKWLRRSLLQIRECLGQ